MKRAAEGADASGIGASGAGAFCSPFAVPAAADPVFAARGAPCFFGFGAGAFGALGAVATDSALAVRCLTGLAVWAAGVGAEASVGAEMAPFPDLDLASSLLRCGDLRVSLLAMARHPP
ncbi:hypothetical protein [Paracoccus sp. S1E-3]|uniref:hypothetical protein n=1 Tax=Paracoccus sp. S1E-3 TaxID=2756130 RepID=UPI0021049160|nr:hypothetical protein [Paracoccus sp. S1E-3]